MTYQQKPFDGAGRLVVALLGLGYVGLPLVVAFGKHWPTIGSDIVPSKVAPCSQGRDPSREIPDAAKDVAAVPLSTSGLF